MAERIYLSSPHMGGTERAYVEEAFATNWVAPLGPNVEGLERAVRDYVGVRAAVALSSGTAAIHLALRLLGVGPGDAVLCPTLTFAASANPIVYQGGTPAFVDCEPGTANMSPAALARALDAVRPKAVVLVHLYGHAARLDELLALCAARGVPVVEDAAESLGSTYRGKQTGSFGRFGVFSFNGNKIVTTSGGGMLVSDDGAAIKKALFWATQSREPARHYEHRELGFNYRLSNVCAGIGRGQMEVLGERIRQKTAIFDFYRARLEAATPLRMLAPPAYGTTNHWLSVALFPPGAKRGPEDVIAALERENIEARPVWKPMHRQPVFAGAAFFPHDEKRGGESVADDLFARGVCLPSDTKMTPADLDRVASVVERAVLG